MSGTITATVSLRMRRFWCSIRKPSNSNVMSTTRSYPSPAVLDNLPHDFIYSVNQFSPWMEVWVEKYAESYLPDIKIPGERAPLVSIKGSDFLVSNWKRMLHIKENLWTCFSFQCNMHVLSGCKEYCFHAVCYPKGLNN